jgi:hypothetical protein
MLTDEAKIIHWQVAATYHDTRGSRPELKRLQKSMRSWCADLPGRVRRYAAVRLRSGDECAASPPRQSRALIALGSPVFHAEQQGGPLLVGPLSGNARVRVLS